MKLCLVLALCACAAAATAPSLEPGHVAATSEVQILESPDVSRNLVANIIINQLFAYLRRIINYGSLIFDIPPLNPLRLEQYHLIIPAKLINLDLNLKNIKIAGLGGFVVHKSDFNLSPLTFDIEISAPQLDISAEEYDLVGALYSAIPLFGKGKAEFRVDNFSFAGKLFLKQSEDRRSVLIDRIENASYKIAGLKSNLSGVIGGGDMDAIVNAITEDVIINYVNRFQAAIASLTSSAIVQFGNPYLDQLDTWRYIAPLRPRTNEAV